MSTDPTMSVVIPTYNGAAFLAEALESVFAQTLPPREIIVVDDKSTDETPGLAEQISRHSPVPMRVIGLEKNSGGPARPINVGVEQASGAFISVLDQDDQLLPESLRWHETALKAVPDASFSFTFAGRKDRPESMIQPDALRTEIQEHVLVRAGHCIVPQAQLLRLFVTRGNFVLGFPGFVFRRRLWDTRRICERWRVAADLDFLCALAEQGDGVLIPHIGYLRRVHAHNVCNRQADMRADIVNVICNRLDRHPRLLAEQTIVQAARTAFLNAALAFRRDGRYLKDIEYHARCLWTLGFDERVFRSSLQTVPRFARRMFAKCVRSPF